MIVLKTGQVWRKNGPCDWLRADMWEFFELVCKKLRIDKMVDWIERKMG